MPPLDAKTLDWLWYDADAREERLRVVVRDRLAEKPPPALDDHVVATYFFAFRTPYHGCGRPGVLTRIV